MIKYASIIFVFFITCIATMGMVSVFLPNILWIEIGIDICGIGLLITGLILILALILDRIKDARKENKNDDFKKL